MVTIMTWRLVMIALMLMSCHILVITLPSVPSHRKTLPKCAVIGIIISTWDPPADNKLKLELCQQ